MGYVESVELIQCLTCFGTGHVNLASCVLKDTGYVRQSVSKITAGRIREIDDLEVIETLGGRGFLAINFLWRDADDVHRFSEFLLMIEGYLQIKFFFGLHVI